MSPPVKVYVPDGAQTDRKCVLPVDISPTYISSDLLCPDHQNRITTPGIGFHVVDAVPLGDKTWGENVTSYGGIGSLPFLGCAKSRDLDVSRNHLHFGSGFSRYETKVQPYRLTPLTLSTCRMNDQVLPPCFQEYLDPKKYVIPSNIPKESYWSHKSMFEVFPRHDPSRKNQNGESVLTAETSESLQKYHHYLYDVPRCHEAYPNNTDLIRSELAEKQKLENDACSINSPSRLFNEKQSQNLHAEHKSFTQRIASFLAAAPGPLSLSTRLLQLLGSSSLYEMNNALMILRGDIYRDSRNLLRKETCHLVDYVSSILKDALGNGGCLPDDNGEKERVTKDRLRKFLTDYNKSEESQVPKCMVPTTTGLRTASANKRHTECLNQFWPPGNSYVVDHHKMQLREVESLTNVEKTSTVVQPESANYCESKERTTGGSLEYNDYCKFKNPRNMEPVQFNALPGLESYKEYLDEFLPVPIGSRKHEFEDQQQQQQQHQQQQQQQQAKRAVTWSYPLATAAQQSSNPQLAMNPAGNLPKELKLPSLFESLHPTGKRIEDRLGLRYKAEAHRRYHAMYTDTIPDLRETQITRKRYFFFGHHASDFRG